MDRSLVRLCAHQSGGQGTPESTLHSAPGCAPSMVDQGRRRGVWCTAELPAWSLRGVGARGAARYGEVAGPNAAAAGGVLNNLAKRADLLLSGGTSGLQRGLSKVVRRSRTAPCARTEWATQTSAHQLGKLAGRVSTPQSPSMKGAQASRRSSRPLAFRVATRSAGLLRPPPRPAVGASEGWGTLKCDLCVRRFSPSKHRRMQFRRRSLRGSCDVQDRRSMSADLVWSTRQRVTTVFLVAGWSPQRSGGVGRIRPPYLLAQRKTFVELSLSVPCDAPAAAPRAAGGQARG